MSFTVRELQRNSKPGPYDHLVRPDGLVHRTLFTDQRLFETEMVKIFGAEWVFLLHEAEIPEPHDFKTITVGLRPVIVVRDEHGDVTALLNRCPHRGSIVCIEESGNRNRFQCPYHGWTFDSSGKLYAIPYHKGYGKTFDREKRGLGRFPRIETYRGFVFGCLNPQAKSLIDWLGPAKEVFDWCVDRENIGPAGVGVVKGMTMVYGGNWKLQNDNNGDMYHAPVTHRSTSEMNLIRHGAGKTLDHFKQDNNPMRAKYFGHGHKLLDQRPSIDSPWMRARPVPGRELLGEAVQERHPEPEASTYLDLTGRSGINLVLYPNLLLMGHGTFAVYEPLAVDLTNVRYYTVVINDAPAEMNTLRIRFSEDFNNVAARDDNEIFERIQKALSTTPEMPWLDFSKGLGTERESFAEDGSVTGNISDETGIRGSYQWWLTLMNREIQTALLGVEPP